MVNEELDMDTDDQIDLEIDGKSLSERSSYEQPDNESKWHKYLQAEICVRGR
jgi:hypothetical protein